MMMDGLQFPRERVELGKTSLATLMKVHLLVVVISFCAPVLASLF